MSRGALYDLLANGHPLSALAAEGRVFYASDADQNDLVTGQTSFAATTPTFLLSNPATSGRYMIPLLVGLSQTGTVAGGAVDIIVEIDNADRYSSGGTQETVLCARTDSPLGATAVDGTGSNKCILYSGATASAGYGIRLAGVTIGQDVSPAEGAIQQFIWTPQVGVDILAPGSSLLIYTYAGTTGPTVFWTIKWAEVPSGLVGF